MKTFDFSLNDVKNGGKITAFNYSHGLNDLVGSWSACVAGGTFKAGETISFSNTTSGESISSSNLMHNGIITRAYKDYEGLWHIEGKDAGINLMKSTPDVASLPIGNAKAVIQFLADFCGISLSMNVNGLSGFNVRSLISASTCAEAILELALISGLIAYINNNGELVLVSPEKKELYFPTIIDDSGSDIDLDGYATQVLVILNRKKNNSDETSVGTEVILGTTPSNSPQRVTQSGTFSNGSFSITTLQPFDVIVKSETSITDNDVTISTVEEHEYDYKTKTIWRDNQEYVLFAFIEIAYTLSKTVSGQYHGVLSYVDAEGTHVTSINPTFSEITTETMTRSMSASKAVLGIPEDWEDSLKMVGNETITRSTVRTGDVTPDKNMPPYSPPFDSRITRTYTSRDDGKKIFCDETEESYEARQIGSIAPVKINGQNVPHFLQGTNLAIQTHSTPQWVLVRKHCSYYEQFDNDGQCLVSAHSEYSDDGSRWLIENGLNDTGDDNMNAYQAAYAAFSQKSNGLQVSIGSSHLSSDWHFLELSGRTKSTTDLSEFDRALGNISEWYDNGQYIYQPVCPHYDSSSKSCNVYIFDTLSGITSPKTSCKRSKGTLQWRSCSRAITALDRAKDIDKAQIEAPIIGTASIGNGNVGYQREFYIDDNITEEQAQSIANTIAENILTVKGLKGFTKTVIIPYKADLQPNGTIVDVSHDWEKLQTSVTYRDKGDIPECLISQSVASIAAFVSARDTARLNVPKYGSVSSVSDKKVSVKIGNSLISCTTKLKNLAQGDIVLVAFPAGNKLRGQVISRL